MKPSPSPPNGSKDYWKLLTLFISIIWPSLVTSWVVVQKIYSKMYLVSCTNTHRDVTDSVNHAMVKNTKTWISWERNISLISTFLHHITFLQNKKILNISLRWHILKSYGIVAEVNFCVAQLKIHETVQFGQLHLLLLLNLWLIIKIYPA